MLGRANWGGAWTPRKRPLWPDRRGKGKPRTELSASTSNALGQELGRPPFGGEQRNAQQHNAVRRRGGVSPTGARDARPPLATQSAILLSLPALDGALFCVIGNGAASATAAQPAPLRRRPAQPHAPSDGPAARSCRRAPAEAAATRAGSAASCGRLRAQSRRVAPCQADRAELRQRLLVEHELRAAIAGRGEGADDNLGAPAILFERQAVEDDAQRLALGQRGDAAEPVARRVRVARPAGSRPSPSAVSHCSAAKALNRLPTIISLPSASRTAA